MMITAGRQKHGIASVPLRFFKAENVAIKTERPVYIRHFQMHMTNSCLRRNCKCHCLTFVASYEARFVLLSFAKSRYAQSLSAGHLIFYLSVAFIPSFSLITNPFMLMTVAHDTQYYLTLEEKFGAHNYHPLPVVLSRGEGV